MNMLKINSILVFVTAIKLCMLLMLIMLETFGVSSVCIFHY